MMLNKIIDRIVDRLDISKFLNKPKKASVWKDLINDPDSFIMTAFVEDGEIKIGLKKKPEEKES